jgi:hypothetical protein
MHDDAARYARKHRKGTKKSRLRSIRTFILAIVELMTGGKDRMRKHVKVVKKPAMTMGFTDPSDRSGHDS